MLRLALTPRWLGFLVLALGLAACFIALGSWQIDRAQHKNDPVGSADIDTLQPLTQVLAPQTPMPNTIVQQKVSLTGHFLPESSVVVANRMHGDQRGYWLVSMFVPQGAQLPESVSEAQPAGKTSGTQATGKGGRPIAIPVVRGWSPEVPTAQARQVPQGTFALTGRLMPTEAPEAGTDLPPGQVPRLATAQLVNMFTMYTYQAYVIPDEPVGADDFLQTVTVPPLKDKGFDLQSAVYAAEWMIFAAFALYIWWRLLRDEYERIQFYENQAAVQEDGDERSSGKDANNMGNGHSGKPGYVVVKPRGQRGLSDYRGESPP